MARTSKPIVVMKFGGTSVADPDKIRRAAERAATLKRKGKSVVVVVSAPGKMTDELIGLAKQMCAAPDPRELDALVSTGETLSISLFALALQSRKCSAISLTGPQAGFEAEGDHTRATITRIRPARIKKELSLGHIVVVAGFQATNPKGEITTLGRGGSDLSAVALAAALKAESCEIFTDVKGVYTADPRLVSQARLIKRLSYEEMLELSAAGAQVMLARSIEVAKRYGVRVHVRSSFQTANGTIIESFSEKKMEQAHVSSLALDKSEIRLSIVEVPDRPGVAAKILSKLADDGIPVDLIVQSAATNAGVNDISFMTPRANSAEAKKSLLAMVAKLGARGVDVQDRVVKLTAVGTGFRRHPKIAATMFETLAKARINIQMISTSDLRVSCVIDGKHGEKALRLLHKAFDLNTKRR